MTRYVLDLHDSDCTQTARVGGKAARLGELARVDGIAVPAGFCVTTDAFERIRCDDALDRLSRLRPDDRAALGALSANLRGIIEAVAIPEDVGTAIAQALTRFGKTAAFAVRSSATAEDLPDASFAGQQDSFLNVSGDTEILRHVRRCWASLYTERAVIHRLRNGYDQRAVRMAVLVQQMVFADAAGVLFTADPVSGNRKVISVEACFGLGDALVAGTVNADRYTLCEGIIVAKTVATKALAVRASPAGGTQSQAVEPEHRTQQALSDAQIVAIADQGRRIAAYLGSPQDIEWCLVGNEFRIVQSRPITTLFPIPAAADDEHRVYVSVGHQQMMTDAMRPLGISVRQLTARTAMHEAGSRMFVEVTRALQSSTGRAALFGMLGKSDPLIGDALESLVERGFVRSEVERAPLASESMSTPVANETVATTSTVPSLIAACEASLADLQREIRTKTGTVLFDAILADFTELQRILFDPQSLAAIMAGIDASWWLNDRMQEWLAETNAADTLTLSAPGNVTSEMGLALLDVADAIRPHADVVAFLEQTERDDFLDALIEIPGGREAREAIQTWLSRYGMRGVAEIDITAPRWSEQPRALLPLLLGNIRNFETGAAARRFEQGRELAQTMETSLLQRLRALPGGEEKADETKRTIDRLRAYIGYREYPKYSLVCRYFVYKQAMLAEAERLVQAGVLDERHDMDYLTFHELHEVVRTRHADRELIRRRRETFRSHQALMPPRVLTSEGECLNGAYRRDDAPAGALVGLAVSSGIVEGRARVIRDLAHADLDADDILVTAYTDPSWTPLFVAIKGLVTEVGGLMTHGAVIAREYGLPAVVSVPDATRRIPDGARIRVNGRDGYVEILS